MIEKRCIVQLVCVIIVQLVCVVMTYTCVSEALRGTGPLLHAGTHRR